MSAAADGLQTSDPFESLYLAPAIEYEDFIITSPDSVRPVKLRDMSHGCKHPQTEAESCSLTSQSLFHYIAANVVTVGANAVC